MEKAFHPCEKCGTVIDTRYAMHFTPKDSDTMFACQNCYLEHHAPFYAKKKMERKRKEKIRRQKKKKTCHENQLMLW